MYDLTTLQLANLAVKAGHDVKVATRPCMVRSVSRFIKDCAAVTESPLPKTSQHYIDMLENLSGQPEGTAYASQFQQPFITPREDVHVRDPRCGSDEAEATVEAPDQ